MREINGLICAEVGHRKARAGSIPALRTNHFAENEASEPYRQALQFPGRSFSGHSLRAIIL
jgi:hypothetical protein